LKKINAILFLSIFLIANTAFGQLLKLPALIQHFHLHENENKETGHDMDFLDFVKMHYYDSNSENPGHDHQNLPFKNISCCCLNNQIVLPQCNHWLHDIPSVSAPVNLVARNQFYSSSAFLATIWQPPRFS